jgi:phospholipid transport system substrate-binding protein
MGVGQCYPYILVRAGINPRGSDPMSNLRQFAGARSFSTIISFVFLSSFFLSGAAKADDADAQAARELVTTFSQTLIGSTERGASPAYKERFDALLPVFHRSFALDILAPATVGRRAWNGWSEPEQSSYKDVLARFLTGTLVRRIKEDKRYQFTFVSIEAGPRESLIVNTLLERANKDDIELDYLVERIDGQWMISDVFAESAVSEVALRRAEFSGTVHSGGQRGLVAALEEKITVFENDG